MFNFKLLEANLEEVLSNLKYIINPEIVKIKFIDYENQSGIIEIITKKNFITLKTDQNMYEELIKELIANAVTRNDGKFFKENLDQLIIDALRKPNINKNSKLNDLI